MLRITFFIIDIISETFLIKRLYYFLFLLIIISPLIFVTIFNNWFVGIVSEGLYMFLSAILTVTAEKQLGLNYYYARTSSVKSQNRIKAFRLINLLIMSLMTIFIFRNISHKTLILSSF